MDLSTNYLGMNLRTPLVASASPLSRNVDDVRRLEQAGAAAVVFHSVFEEKLQSSRKAADFRVDLELYLNHIAQAKRVIEQAGADALELNIYTIPADMDVL